MEKELDEENVEGAVGDGENPVEKVEAVCSRVLAGALETREDRERGGEEEEEEVEEEAKAEKANVKSVVLVFALLWESVDFCEANDQRNDPTQVQEAVLDLEGFNQKRVLLLIHYLFNNFPCVRISIRLHPESNGDAEAAEDYRPSEDQTPLGAAEVQPSQVDKRLGLGSCVFAIFVSISLVFSNC